MKSRFTPDYFEPDFAPCTFQPRPRSIAVAKPCYRTGVVNPPSGSLSAAVHRWLCLSGRRIGALFDFGRN